MTTRSVNGILANYTINDLNQVTNAASVPCTYDQNGNRITSGQASGTTQYAYDDDNRLTRVSYSTAYRTDFAYDGLGRLRVRTEYTWYNYTWNVSSVTRYLYDGKRVIQERDGNNNNPLVAYTRGKDLSGSLEGAGGIGGLLARSAGYSGGNWTSHAFYHADGNGNITYMVDSSQGWAASYRYDPYGRTISSGGPLAAANVYRFSSKEFHANSGFYYYLYRFYDPNTQRWPNRDPLVGYSVRNLFEFCANSPTLYFDPNGDNPLIGGFLLYLFVAYVYEETKSDAGFPSLLDPNSLPEGPHLGEPTQIGAPRKPLTNGTDPICIHLPGLVPPPHRPYTPHVDPLALEVPDPPFHFQFPPINTRPPIQIQPTRIVTEPSRRPIGLPRERPRELRD